MDKISRIKKIKTRGYTFNLNIPVDITFDINTFMLTGIRRMLRMGKKNQALSNQRVRIYPVYSGYPC